MNTTSSSRRTASSVLPGAPRAFTLIELMVVIVIIAILASLSLAGLNGARQRAKIDKTKTTIRKLHEIVMPLYESYVERRITHNPTLPTVKKKAVSAPTSRNDMLSSIAGYQVLGKRHVMATDLPDLWDDAWTKKSPGHYSDFGYISPNPRYQAIGAKLFPPADANLAMAYESAECLYMIVVRSGFAADAIEQFRADEIGDFDRDGAPEFLDGWGRPISFIRWPVGFRSVLQTTTDTDPPDPLDPLGVTRSLSNPLLGGGACTDRAVVPLIYSGGPNDSLDIDTSATAGSYGLVTSRDAIGGLWQDSGWVNPDASNWPDGTTTRWPTGGPWAGMVKAGSANGRTNQKSASDNITNHDLVTK